MGVRENKEAVKIDDWVSDIRGSFIGWIDATDELPPGKNMEAYRIVYSPHVDGNKSWLAKFVSIVGRFLWDVRENTWAFEVSDNIYPRAGIEGFEGGTTVTGIESESGTPDKRVILREDVDGNRPYMNQVGPGSEGISKTKTELQEKVNELQQALEAEEGKSHELEQQVDRDSDSNRSRNRRGGAYSPEEYGMEEEYTGDFE